MKPWRPHQLPNNMHQGPPFCLPPPWLRQWTSCLKRCADRLPAMWRVACGWSLLFDTLLLKPSGPFVLAHVCVPRFTGVNNAQAIKSAAVWYRQSGNKTLDTLSQQRVTNLDNMWGLPTGMYCADELLCGPPNNRMPSRGVELCAVVEAMFSFNTMFSQFGHVSFLDRAERIRYGVVALQQAAGLPWPLFAHAAIEAAFGMGISACAPPVCGFVRVVMSSFNALPATWASPTGGDMWAHQYLQAVNEINAMKADPHIWTHDGDQAELYGLEPNYGCCTANFNQGWPKVSVAMGACVWMCVDVCVCVCCRGSGAAATILLFVTGGGGGVEG
jgi:hypothetical protein